MKLGKDLYQDKGKHIDYARAAFLRAVEEVAPEVLQDLKASVYPAFLGGAGVQDALGDWARRHHLLLDGEPAAWVIETAITTLRWWKRGKPTGEELLSGRDGTREIDPAQFCLMFLTIEFGNTEVFRPKDYYPAPAISTAEGTNSALKRIAHHARQQYLRRAEAIAEQRKKHLQKTPRKDWEHFLLTARFHVSSSMPPIQAAVGGYHEDRAAYKAVADTLEMIGLTPWRKRGRRSSKKTAPARTKTHF